MFGWAMSYRESDDGVWGILCGGMERFKVASRSSIWKFNRGVEKITRSLKLSLQNWQNEVMRGESCLISHNVGKINLIRVEKL